MIQALMLVSLGFLLATLIGIVLAPSLWKRAYRLSKQRVEATLPLSLDEIESSRDQIKATYAVRLRRLETALAKSKQKIASQLVDNSRLQMQIATLGDAVAEAESKLAERQNAVTVLEHTIARRMPDLEREIASRKQELGGQSQELENLQLRLQRRDEQLAAAQKSATALEQEVERVRQAMEKTSGDTGGRRLRRPSQWTLEDYRGEYDRLNLELSRMRQQVLALQDKDAQQTGLIRGELQKLAELVLATRDREAASAAPSASARVASRERVAEVRRERPTPYVNEGASGAAQRSQPPLSPSSPAGNPGASLARPGATQPASGVLPSAPVDPVSPPSVSTQPKDAGALPSGEFAPAPPVRKPLIVQDVTKPATPVQPKGTAAPETNGSVPPSVPKEELPPLATTDADKALEDAQRLKVISELSPHREGAAPQKQKSAIAEEAENGGLVIELDAIAPVPSRPKEATQVPSASRNLLDRLKGVTERAETADT
jgi:predicted  nucleic acid-binding Zn-ribbon protein